MNTTQFINGSDDEKANVFIERVNQGAKFRKDGTVEDNELSIVIGLSHLSRLKDEQVKTKAIEELMTNEKNKSPELIQLLKDYFPKYKDKR